MEELEKRILLVDDTPENLDVLSGLLKSYKKSVAINGIEALKIAQSINKPDLILLDIMMPEMDGYETCKKLKENKLTKNIPVIFMTALSETIDKLKGFELGAVDYVTKPFEPEELLKRIETHLEISRLQKELKEHNELLEQKVSERTAELKESNKNLIVAKEKAEIADSFKSIFLAQMSHEIRTPINIMVSYASLLQSDLDENSDESLIHGLKSISTAGNRLVRTTDLIINLSEIQSGNYKADFTKIDINLDVLAGIFFNFNEVAKNKNIKLNLLVETEDTKLVADLYTLNQIFSQIIENAIIFTDSGSITIKVSKKSGDSLVVEIIDTGIGISDEYLKDIFVPFSQEEMGYTRKYDGNGIGLALVEKYCKLNNATIEVESKKGIGSTFRVIFN